MAFALGSCGTHRPKGGSLAVYEMNNRPFVRVEIQGHSHDFLVDSGANSFTAPKSLLEHGHFEIAEDLRFTTTSLAGKATHQVVREVTLRLENGTEISLPLLPIGPFAYGGIPYGFLKETKMKWNFVDNTLGK